MIKISRITAPLLLASTLIFASDIYNIKVDDITSGETFSKGSSNLSDIINLFETDSFIANLPGYNDTDNVKATLDMRGLPVNLSYIGNKIIFNVPSINVNESFEGNTRDESNQLFEDWMKNNGAGTMEKIMKELARVSPVDPIAGNSNSVMFKSVESDFTSGFLNTASKQNNSTSNGNANQNTFSIMPSFKSLDVDGKNSNSYSLPLEYAFVSKDDANQKLAFKLPLSYTEVEGATSYSLGLGLAYYQPITDEWTITPSLGYSMVGSIDLGTLAQVGSASLTSSYTYELNESQRLSLGNMVGYYSTVKFYSGDYAYDPGIKNVVYRNALMYSIDTDNLMNNTSIDLYAINTKFTGTELYNDQYNEFGFSFGYNKINVNILSDNEKLAYRRALKIGASYLTSENESGVKINFGLTF